MNDFDKKVPVEDSVQGNKPKMVLKDSSKYVKKKPVSKLQQSSIPGTPTGSEMLKPPTPT
jgi:hypothetical protein